MADKYVVYFLMTVLFFFNVDSYKIQEVDKDFNKSHLDDPIVKKYCANKDVVCRSNDSAICAIRYVNGSSFYQDFRNHCYLFFSNICGNHGEDFLTLTDGSCEDYLALRRNEEENEETTKPEETTEPEEKTEPEETTELEKTTEPEETTELEQTTEPEQTTKPDETTDPEEKTEPEETTELEETTEPEQTTKPDETTQPEENNDNVDIENNSTETTTDTDNTILRNQVAIVTTEPEENNENVDNENNSTETTTNTDSPILRNQATTTAPITNIHTENNETFDGLPCPYSCPKIYKPVCLNVNRGYGKYFKMLFFVNHCTGALYYCRHPGEFTQPPGEEYAEDPGAYVLSSPLDWSFCGAYKYLQFARFAESASSMAHYGWLHGDYRYSHIMQNNEKFPNM